MTDRWSWKRAKRPMLPIANRRRADVLFKRRRDGGITLSQGRGTSARTIVVCREQLVEILEVIDNG